MEDIKIYSAFCYRCLPKTERKPHKICGISRKKGIKLQCLRCQRIKNKYTNFNKLEEYNE